MADLVETAASVGSFKTLLTVVEAAGLLDALKSPGSLALFAPTDEAFAKIPATTIASWMEDIPKLKKIVAYHVVPGDVRSDDLLQIDEAPTLEGSIIAIDNSDGVKVNDAKVLQQDILADNGVIHVIDTVLMPALVAGH
ncbi:fasciclin domain-containing protein [Planktothrix sp. FACHB-1355]|uniref:Fasciclin domain-containing protein n=1 Tax=Aerosakkonema funiforme FACHB-1375 TaxID=2949571 RepID=A0A926ZHX4_9CYAN|nr:MULTISPECIES: fasciclin domain-containing protein [Oscillatoriales]MBD2181206.1 fasciclin domain-containing protein [Aerosakkonema funiforme FACHB-1375]MBD3561514.1 fasciclin domain-containing protein [Planktothrix sp. FACHB-1355]